MTAQIQDYAIREMRRDDLKKVTALEAACFSMPWKYMDFEEVLSNPHRVYLVAETEKQEIIGGCMLTEIVGEGDISMLRWISVFAGKKLQRRFWTDFWSMGAGSMASALLRWKYAAKMYRQSVCMRAPVFGQKASGPIFMRNPRMMP